MTEIINPLTQRRIQFGGSTHRKLVKEGVLDTPHPNEMMYNQMGGGIDKRTIDGINAAIKKHGQAYVPWPMEQWSPAVEMELRDMYNVNVGGRMGYEMENPFSRMIEVTIKPKGGGANGWLIFAKNFYQQNGRRATRADWDAYKKTQSQQGGYY